MTQPAPPLAILFELTHRCPLQCPYCSNPKLLERASAELDTTTLLRVIEEAADLGVLQVHFSGGEPMARKDLSELIRHAAKHDLYSNLITSAVMLDATRVTELKDAGLNHVQISFQDASAANANRIGGFPGGHERKLAAAEAVRKSGLALTLNFVVHRQNAENIGAMLALGEELGAGRLEIAHVQYYGWALANRAALLPSRDQLRAITAVVEAERARLKGRITIDYVVPDYYAIRPKACMAGWARRFMNISPSGKALPCHAAETLTGLEFPSVREYSLAHIWCESVAFQKFRGTEWMTGPCRECARREIDWGGCRCQAFALTGDASRTDPACSLSPDHEVLVAAIRETEIVPPPFVYRRFGSTHARP